MPTFDFLKKHITNAIDLTDNILLGGFAGSVMELLGRILFFPNEKANSTDRIFRFIKEYLGRQNKDYETYKEIFVFLLRNGGAHCVLPKQGVNLTGDPRAEELHLTLKKDYNSPDYYWFTIFSPKFKKDLKNAVLDFVFKAGKDEKLQNNYLAVMEKIAEEGNDFLKEKITKGEYRVETNHYLNLQGDIKL